jgi:multiple sugar transport system substrate-binding protein
MKKFSKILLVVVMMMGLVACGGGSKDSGDKITLTFWGHQNVAWNKAYEDVAKKFEEENSDINIEFEFFPYDQFESKVQTSLSSKEGGADIYEMWGGWGIDFAPTGALEPISADLQKNIEENYYESTYGALLSDGKIYGLPLEFNIEYGAMLVQNDLMKAANVAVPTTWDELVDAGIKGTVMDGNTFVNKGFDFVNWDSVPYMFLAMTMSQGGTYLNEDGTFNLQTPEAEAAFQELHDLITVDKVTDLEGLAGGGDLEGYQQLFAGRNMIVPRGAWTIAEAAEEFDLTLGKEFDYVSMPWFGEQKSFAAETGWSVAVNSGSENKDAAMKFMEFMSRPEVLLELNIACAQIPADKTVATDPALIEGMPYAEPLVEILDSGHFIGLFNTDVFKENVNDIFERYVSGEFATAKEALVALEEVLNEKTAKK